MGQFSDIGPVKRCYDMSGVGPTQTLCNVSSHAGCLGQIGLVMLKDPVWASSKVICLV
jgi:hypothetical protein